VLKLAIMATFAWIFHASIATARGELEGLGPWFLPVTFASTLIPIIVTSVLMRRVR